MTEGPAKPVPRAPIDTDPVDEVARRADGLTPDELAVVTGAVTAVGSDAPNVPNAVVDTVGVLTTLRRTPCPFCGGRTPNHAIDWSAGGVAVRCRREDSSRPVAQWAAGRGQPGAEELLAARRLWLTWPAFTLGLLGFVPAVRAAVQLRTRTWVNKAIISSGITGGLWGTALAVGAAEPGLSSASAASVPGWAAVAIIGLLGGSVGYNAAQIGPYLEATAPPPGPPPWATDGHTPSTGSPVAALTAPAGWYPNPAGTGLRYFDGRTWTEHIASAG